MTINGLLQIVLFLVALALITKPLGLYLFHVVEGTSAVNRIFGPLERLIYRVLGTRPDAEMNWQTYTAAWWRCSSRAAPKPYCPISATCWRPSPTKPPWRSSGPTWPGEKNRRK